MKRSAILYIRAIATVGSLLAMLLIGWPLADEYVTHTREFTQLRELKDEFKQLKLRQAKVDASRDLLQDRLKTYAARSIDADSVMMVRDNIVEMVRKHGCRIRQIGVEEPSERPWSGLEDDPLKELHNQTEWNPGEYNLVSSRLNLTISGEFDDIKKLCYEIAQAKYLAVTEYVSLQPVDATGSSVQMELRIKLFGVSERNDEELEDFPDDTTAFRIRQTAVNG